MSSTAQPDRTASDITIGGLYRYGDDIATVVAAGTDGRFVVRGAADGEDYEVSAADLSLPRLDVDAWAGRPVTVSVQRQARCGFYVADVGRPFEFDAAPLLAEKGPQARRQLLDAIVNDEATGELKTLYREASARGLTDPVDGDVALHAVYEHVVLWCAANPYRSPVPATGLTVRARALLDDTRAQVRRLHQILVV